MQEHHSGNNMLENWYKEAMTFSSILVLPIKISRKKIDLIYTTLSTYFGLSFFNIKGNGDKEIHKINWLFGLLNNNKNIACMHALHDVAALIEYAGNLDESLQLEMKNLKRSPENLRTFFYELFIYRMLDMNGIKNQKKPVINNQVLEGIVTLDNSDWLFECRKMFLPNIHELDIMRRLLTDVYKCAYEMKTGRGMICRIQFNRPMEGRHRSNFENKIRQYFAAVNNDTTSPKIDYVHSDDCGTFAAIHYDEASLVEIQFKKQYDILVQIVPPAVPAYNMPNFYQVKMDANFMVDQERVYKKFETVLREKKEQHRQSEFLNKIIFLDSEILPEFHMNLFHNESIYEPDRIRTICKKRHPDAIVCVMLRSYNDKGPTPLMDLIYPDKHAGAATELKKIASKCYPLS